MALHGITGGHSTVTTGIEVVGGARREVGDEVGALRDVDERVGRMHTVLRAVGVPHGVLVQLHDALRPVFQPVVGRAEAGIHLKAHGRTGHYRHRRLRTRLQAQVGHFHRPVIGRRHLAEGHEAARTAIALHAYRLCLPAARVGAVERIHRRKGGYILRVVHHAHYQAVAGVIYTER